MLSNIAFACDTFISVEFTPSIRGWRVRFANIAGGVVACFLPSESFHAGPPSSMLFVCLKSKETV